MNKCQLKPMGEPENLSIVEHYYLSDSIAQSYWDKSRWPDFSPRELSCGHSTELKRGMAAFGRVPALKAGDLVVGAGDLLINTSALDSLQELRSYIKKPLIIDSAFRSTEYNHYIGGEPDSQHLLGRAFDINHANLSIKDNYSLVQFLTLAASAGFKGFGLYDNFTHCDIGPARWWDFRTRKTMDKELSSFLQGVRA